MGWWERLDEEGAGRSNALRAWTWRGMTLICLVTCAVLIWGAVSLLEG